jgi:hypothetical protein
VGLSLESLCEGLQFDEHNSFVGLEERHEALNHLGVVLQNRTDYFGEDVQRPGNLIGKVTVVYFFLKKELPNTRYLPFIL